MNTDALKSKLVEILKKRDPKWFAAVAASLDKAPEEVTFADLAPIKFGEFTTARVLSDVEFLFGVCLPLNIRGRQWSTLECFSYLESRARNASVNLNLARNRTAPHNLKTLALIILQCAYLLVFPPIIYFLWLDFGITILLVGIFPLMIAIAFIDFLLTHSYYLRLGRRIEAMRD